MRIGLILIFALFVLLFVGGPGHHADRLVFEIWQTGHFTLFAAIVFISLQINLIGKQKWLHLFIATGLFSCWFGVATEALQYLVGRSFEFTDV